ncbi:MAG TPA: acyl-CoA carboxylase epsilon subunit [Acidimicrobiia bacterium]|nr:acyl-CoA carboxylase epsilon subunit [Acidimicrobiia bacterium]
MTDELPLMRIESIRPEPTDVEVAAITATLGLLATRRRDAGVHPEPERLSVWVDASRRSAQRAGLQRGPWRLSGRIARRSRA